MRSFLAFAVLVVAGCSDEGAGELGNGSFRYRCVDPLADAWCDADQPSAGIALGARFALEFEPGPRAPLSALGARVSSPTPAVAELPDGALRADSAGYAVLHARDPDGALVDLIHLDVREVAALVVVAGCEGADCRDEASLPSLALGVGAPRDFRVVPRGAAGAVLAGAISPEWAISPSGVATVERAAGATVTLAGVAAGAAELAVTFGELTARLPVEVAP